MLAENNNGARFSWDDWRKFGNLGWGVVTEKRNFFEEEGVNEQGGLLVGVKTLAVFFP